MFSLLDYSTKKTQMLQEYYAQLVPQFDADEPWNDAHTWAICTGEIEALIRETLHLYVNLLRADEFHHYCAVTRPQYPYAETAQHLEGLFTNLHALLVQEAALAERVTAHGSTLQGADALRTCLQEVERLLAEESPVYTTDTFQALLQQSLDDIQAGRLVEMTPEQL